MPFWLQATSGKFLSLMTDHSPVSEADLAALKVTLTNLTTKSLLKVQETITRELQTRLDTEQLVEGAPPPWRQRSPEAPDEPSAKRSRRGRFY